ncbi:hybrid sensor histidine kinase/response regulator [Chlorogloea sp. CCALA 695]|uniref:hybrid sensor histidine kinase/response regulator n=1 Tax=Chlorogloea sp. CCALA 695 TaxID=2107693 RepID=UPI000D06395E|nr:GAF domain-containing protein [Chlorogloea sp. CCALA 695]PSB27724.1 histidine kinase [Chlorogloea sp. CCALA 695]
MNLDEFSQQIEELRSRVAALLQRTNSSPISEQKQVAVAFEQLQIALKNLEGAEAEEVLRQQTERERLVVKIAQRIRQSLNLEEILNTTVSEVRQFLQADRVFIYRFEPDWGGLVVVESVSDDWKPILGSRLKDPTFVESYVQPYKQGRIQATEDIYAGELTPCYVDFLAEFQVRAALIVPILQGEQLWGLLEANQCSSPRQWQQLEINLLKQLATQVAIAIQQSTLFEQIQTELNERKQAEQTIREQAALLNVATDAIFVCDLKNKILFWNKGAERLYGWMAQEAEGNRINELMDQNIAVKLEDVHNVLAEGGSWQGELDQVTKEGKEVIVFSRWTLVRDQEQRPKSLLVVNTNITEKKQLEVQFLRAQRLESLGTLASGMAHDLNNVLTPILMSVQLLLLKFPDLSTQQLLETLEINVKRGAGLVKQVLSFARGVEGERMTLQVQHLILEIEQIAKQTFPKSIEVYTDVPSDLWTVSGNATHLHQVLMNLCVNARDAMPNGGTLSISAENLFIDTHYAQMYLEAQAGNYIVITISDTGMGITPENLERIFEPFFTTKEFGEGTGLGLSTVMGIVKNHGGFVDVTSQVGKGTQFHVFLPAVSVTPSPPADELGPPKGHGELILVVDDEDPIREITRIMLENFNHQVNTASNGNEALALYGQQKSDIKVVLMDMMMPSMDGATTIHTMQKINPQVKIIAVSGLASNDKVVEAAGFGSKAFLSKPYTAQELLKTINEVLSAS